MGVGVSDIAVVGEGETPAATMVGEGIGRLVASRIPTASATTATKARTTNDQRPPWRCVLRCCALLPTAEDGAATFVLAKA